jgi:hypothetical protein
MAMQRRPAYGAYDISLDAERPTPAGRTVTRDSLVVVYRATDPGLAGGVGVA